MHIKNILNTLRAVKQVFTFELRILFVKEGAKFYIIETSRIKRVKMYREAWNNIGYVKGHKLLRYFLDNFDVDINIYIKVKGDLFQRYGTVRKHKNGVEIIKKGS
ncbi:MAG: hypothetical protein ACRC6U_04065 [Fusobacteriaceae bacterium]